MLVIKNDAMTITSSDLEFSFQANSEHAKMKNFIQTLAEKINLSPTLEKVTFFHLFKYYVSEDEIDFHYKTKKRFVRRFIYNEVGGIIRRKSYSYIDPVSLSLYVPEFYETVNEIFEGENVNLPVFNKTVVSDVSEENKPAIDAFWEHLHTVISTLLLEPSEHFTTLLLIKFLKDGGDNIPVYDNEGFFYSAFRKVDVLENDDVSLYLDDDKIDKSSRQRKASKDAIVWNIINPHIRANKSQKNILINDEFREKLCEFIDK